MKLNNILPSFRLDSETMQLMNKTLEEVNQNEFNLKINRSTFIRMAIRNFCLKIKTEGISLTFQPHRN